MMFSYFSNRTLLSISCALGIFAGAAVSAAAATSAASLSEVLNADGSIDLSSGRAGSFSGEGWTMRIDAEGAPRFLRAADEAREIRQAFAGRSGEWDPRFGVAGVEGEIRSLALFDGDLYVGGEFTAAGGQEAMNVARWDGVRWHALGLGVDGPVNAMVAAGPYLMLGGSFQNASGLPMPNVAFWDPAAFTWTGLPMPIGGEVNVILADVVSDTAFVGGAFEGGLLRSDPGLLTGGAAAFNPVGEGLNGAVHALWLEGSTLYVGGEFTASGMIALQNVAQSDLTAFFPMGNGTDGPVTSLAVVDSVVYAGGDFTVAGGKPAAGFAQWDGTVWDAVDVDVEGINLNKIFSLAADGSVLFVAGEALDLNNPAPDTTRHVMLRWNGIRWSDLGGDLDGAIGVMLVMEDRVVVGGLFDRLGGLLSQSFGVWLKSGEFNSLTQGIDGTIHSLAVGLDRRVYIGGDFERAGTLAARSIAVWDGTALLALGGGLNGPVLSVIVTEGDVFVGGQFTEAGGERAVNVARWDGQAWSGMGPGLDGAVRTLALESGTLIAGGDFLHTGNREVNRIARWTGDFWESIGPGFNHRVLALASRGGSLVAGGDFTATGDDSHPLAHIATWNGVSWDALGKGIDGPVAALAVSADGTIYAGGQFNQAGSILAANNLARWTTDDGWKVMKSGVNGPVRAFFAGDAEVIAAGSFTSAGGVRVKNMARWNVVAEQWNPIADDEDSGVDGNVLALAATRSEWFVGGAFAVEDRPDAVRNLARMPRTGWTDLAFGLNGPVSAIATDGRLAYVGGDFTAAGGLRVSGIASWDGSGWSSPGSGVDGIVRALAIGESGELFAGGDFLRAGGIQVFHLGKWDGNEWSALGIGLDGPVHALTVNGQDLYAGGEFSRAGGFSANGIAVFRDGRWNRIGAGFNGPVYAMTLDSDGVLYAGGNFSESNGEPVANVAMWTGTEWVPIGLDPIAGGLNGSVRDLLVWNGALYAAGTFTSAGNAPDVRSLAKWNGVRWERLGGGIDGDPASVNQIRLGSGDGLYVAGNFRIAGGTLSNHIALWDGFQWSKLGSGLDLQATAVGVAGRQVIVGGDFSAADGDPSRFFGIWTFENLSPLVRFRGPNIGDPFKAPARIVFDIDAADPDGAIDMVRIFSGDDVIATLTESPYQFEWEDVEEGQWTLRAVATDNDGAETTSSPLVLDVKNNVLPTGRISAPENNAEIVTRSLRIETEVADSDGRVAQVEFLNGDQSLATLSNPPFEFVWPNTPPGVHTLTIRMVDDSGAESQSTPVSVTVITPPEIESGSIVRLDTGEFGFSISGPPGSTVSIHSSTDLSTWETVAEILLTDEPFEFRTPLTDDPARYFRLAF